ncbi:hypothetical protein [Streptacidiphilus neutrinimicus]|uniref:hypothetical protein n=1 Tax=Streptacidiphilus neutrinimicus TaxID=105420 RepID=UPI0005AAE070|nr:hypothetical protein [Streptacidiphilus neutrinimicus]
MNELLARLLVVLTALSVLGWLTWALSAWHLYRMRTRRFARDVELLRPAAAARDRDWFATCLEELHASVERDLATSVGIRVGAELWRQDDRLSAEAAEARPGPPRPEVPEDGRDLSERQRGVGAVAHQHADLERVPGDGMGREIHHANADTHARAPHEEQDARAGRGGAGCRVPGDGTGGKTLLPPE